MIEAEDRGSRGPTNTAAEFFSAKEMHMEKSHRFIFRAISLGVTQGECRVLAVTFICF